MSFGQVQTSFEPAVGSTKSVSVSPSRLEVCYHEGHHLTSFESTIAMLEGCADDGSDCTAPRPKQRADMESPSWIRRLKPQLASCT
jgi:hypothetical protein